MFSTSVRTPRRRLVCKKTAVFLTACCLAFYQIAFAAPTSRLRSSEGPTRRGDGSTSSPATRALSKDAPTSATKASRQEAAAKESPRSESNRGEGNKGQGSPEARSLKVTEGTVQVNLREAKLDQIVKFIADNTGKSVIVQPGVEATINVVAPKPLPVKDSLDLVYQSLLLQKVLVIETETRIAIVKSDSAAVIPLPIETGKTDTGSTWIMKLIPLKHVDPDMALTYVSSLFEDQKAIRSLPAAGALLVKGTRSDVARVESIISEIDRPDEARLEIRIYPLKQASAQTVTQQIMNLTSAVFEGGPGGKKKDAASGDQSNQSPDQKNAPGKSDATKMRIIPDETNRRLIVAATPELLKYVEQLLEQLDQKNADAYTMHQIDLQNADPQSVANLITQMYRELSATDAEKRSVRAFAQGHSLFIVSSKEQFAEVEQLAKRLDSAEPVMTLRIFSLKHAEARQLSQIVQNLLQASYAYEAASMPASGPASEAASQSASGPASRSTGVNAVSVDRNRNFEKRVEMLRQLTAGKDKNDHSQKDGKQADGGAPDANAMMNMKGSDLRAMIMERLMGGGGGSSSGGRRAQGKQATVAVDERMNSLIVVAYPDQLDQITDLLKQVDVAEPGDLAIRMVNISSGKADELVRAVQNLFQSMARTRGSRNAVQLSASPDGRKLIILSTQDDYRYVQQIVQQLEGGTDLKLHTVAVNYNDPAMLAEMVTEINGTMGKTSATVSVTPHLDGKSLLVMASDRDFAAIEELIKQLDNKESITLRIFELKSADAEQIAPLIESAIDAGYASTSGQGSRRSSSNNRNNQQHRQQQQQRPNGSTQQQGVQIYPDKRTNTLIVVGTPEDIETVGDLVAKMDHQVATDLAVRTIDLTYTRGSEIQNALQRVFSRLPHESDRDTVEISSTRDDKRLLVLSSEENYKKIVDLIKQMDSHDNAELTVVPLQYADASALASVLGNMLRTARAGATGGSNRGGSGQGEVYRVYGETNGLFTTKSDVTIIAETRINALLVAAAPEDLKIIQDLVKKLDQPREEQLTNHVMKLNYADASAIAEAASQFFKPASNSPRDQVKILANVYDNSLMVFASDENWKRIQDFVKQMDVEDVGKRGLKTYDLKYIDAARLASQLEALYTEQTSSNFWDWYFGGSGPRRNNGTKVNFVPSPIGNKLMVVAPPQEITKIDELVKQLDSPQALEGIKPRVYYISHTDATQMRDILSELFSGQSSQSNNLFNMYRPQNRRAGNANDSLGDVNFVVDRDANALIAFSSNPANLDMLDELITQLDVMAPESTNTETVQLEYGDAYSMSILLNSLYGGTQPRNQGPSANAGRSPNQPSGNNNSSYSSLEPTRTNQVKPDYQDLYFWWQSSNERQDPNARPISTLIEQVRIVPDLRTNSLLLTAAPHHLEPLKALIAYLDRPEPQVIIKTRIVEIVQRGEKRVGVRWTPDPTTIRPEELSNAVTALNSLSLFDAFGNKTTGNTTISQGGVENRITRSWTDAGQHILGTGINVTLLVQLLLGNSNSRELSKPTLTVDNNETGTIFVGADVPFITNSQVTDNGTRNDSYEYREVGTRLDITPHINSKGQVVLEIDLGSSNIREGATLLGGAILDRRTYSTQVALEDGQTLVLGGILGHTVKDNEVKVPILGDIPLLGHAFRKNEKLNESTELVAFVSPEVLWNREDADKASKNMIRQTSPENASYYPEIKPPTETQYADMKQMEVRRGAVQQARDLERARSWDYNIAKVRKHTTEEELNRAYQILQFGQEQKGTQGKTGSLPQGQQMQQVSPGVWKIDEASRAASQPLTSRGEDVLRARLNELLEQRNVAPAASQPASGAVLNYIRQLPPSPPASRPVAIKPLPPIKAPYIGPPGK